MLAAHLRKAHGILDEAEIANYTNNDNEEVTVDCLLCGVDMTNMDQGTDLDATLDCSLQNSLSAEENEHFEKVHQLYNHVSFTTELATADEEEPRSRLNSIGSNPLSESDHSRSQHQVQPQTTCTTVAGGAAGGGVSDYHPLSDSVKRFRQFGPELENLYGYHYY